MKKFICTILAIVMFVGTFLGCNSKKDTLNHAFVKPEKYAAVVNVSINPSFDIYLDEKAIVLAVEPKNEDAKKLDFSDVIGLELKTAMFNLMDTICQNTSLNRESVALVKYVEGEGNMVNVDVFEIINSACADAVAKETVNESIESVLQVRLEEEYGCRCLECNNWYERKWYSYIESSLDCPREVYENYMENWKKGIETLDKNDPLYAPSLEQYENMTFEKFDFKEYKRRQDYLQHLGMYGIPADEEVHKERVITYKILDSVSNKSGSTQSKTEEFTAEEYFEKNPDDRDIMEGLEKVRKTILEVYVNGEKDYDYCTVYLYLCNGKWFASEAHQWSFG